MTPRHRRRPTSHRRRSGRATGLPVRRLALAAGALTVVAGVGTGVAVLDPGGDGAEVAQARSEADRVASSASPMAEEATPTTASSAASKAASPKRKKASARPTPQRTVNKTPIRTLKQPRSVTTAARSNPAPRQAAPAATGEAARVLQLVNQARSEAGCSPLSSEAKLTAAAQQYSDVMAETGQMSHTGPDGSQVSDRVEREGYVWSAVGENIAQGQPDADAVMDAWMHSEGHRANILNCSFKDIGIGVHEGDGGPWWTQDFGSSR